MSIVPITDCFTLMICSRWWLTDWKWSEKDIFSHLWLVGILTYNILVPWNYPHPKLVLAGNGYYIGDYRLMIFLKQSSFLYLLVSPPLSHTHTHACIHTHIHMHVCTHFLHLKLPQTCDVWFIQCAKHIKINFILIILSSPVHVPNLICRSLRWLLLPSNETDPGSLCTLFVPGGEITAHFSVGLWYFWVQNANQKPRSTCKLFTLLVYASEIER